MIAKSVTCRTVLAIQRELRGNFTTHQRTNLTNRTAFDAEPEFNRCSKDFFFDESPPGGGGYLQEGFTFRLYDERRIRRGFKLLESAVAVEPREFFTSFVIITPFGWLSAVRAGCP